MIETPTYIVTVYCGLKEGYDGIQHNISDIYPIIREYVDREGLCVSIEEVYYIFKNGGERGAKITIINYPRFPSTKEQILNHAINIGNSLKERFKQYRISIVTPETTYMLGEK